MRPLTAGNYLQIVADKKNNTITFSATVIRGNVLTIQKPLKDLVDIRIQAIRGKRGAGYLGNNIMYIFADYSVVEIPIPLTFNHGVIVRQMDLFHFEGNVE